IYGSLYALRGYIAAVFVAWTLAALCGAIQPLAYATLLAGTLAVGVFMVTIGVWASLSCASATMAMTLTLVGWLGGICVLAVASTIVVLVLLLFGTILYVVTTRVDPATAQWIASVGFGTWFAMGYTVVRLLLY